ncbi:LytR C-terminal domain-containing protein [Specibacter cremeus]|uniref:LytR C-terminal domain-containing protein n=1 Tax=Specibacter cremeus TaxID=1629051 RepID=UPI000F78E995|nr:LytR C-terminal domain-containing protein [Specibacter cremeus]
MTEVGGPGDEQALTTAQARHLRRETKRQLKDEKFEAKLARKRNTDVSVFRGHHVVDAESLAEAFPEVDPAEDNPVRFRHQLTHGVTLFVLVAMVVAGVVLAVLINRGDIKLAFGNSSPTPAPTCPAATHKYLPNKTVTVNVYNSTYQEGLAGTVAAELKKRGYQVKKIANSRTDYTGTAVVVSGPVGQGAAFNIQRNILGTEYVADHRADATVDVYLTSDFRQLVPAKEVNTKPGVLSCPRMSPPPTTPAATPKAG